jgi:hypothetical protein
LNATLIMYQSIAGALEVVGPDCCLSLTDEHPHASTSDRG